MVEQLNGKVVLVTGAGSSIGRAVALAPAREGARVVVSDVAVEGGEETVRIIGDAGGEADFVGADVSSAKEVEALVGGAVESCGRPDCAVNNAGIEGALAPTADYPDETHPEAYRQLAELHPMGRLGKPEEIAEAAVWLCSDASSFVTGHALVANGGYVAQ